jgi:predicted nucleotide-binding protein
MLQQSLTMFISYSSEDEKLRAGLEFHLVNLKRQGLIRIWHDRKIEAGNEWANQINQHIERVQLVLLLVSPSYLNSHYCYDVEFARILERHDAGDLTVIPIILRPCDWQSAPFGRFQALPKNGRPVTTWRNRDAAFLDVTRSIQDIIAERQQSAIRTPEASEKPTEWEVSRENEVSIELTINKDIDQFGSEQQTRLLNAISKLLKSNHEIKITQKKKGSVRLVFQLAPEDAERLLLAAKGGQLAELSVVDGRLASSSSFSDSRRRPTVFIGSSKEGLEIAEALQANMDEHCEITLWSQGAFGLGEGYLEALVKIKNNFDFAILVLTPDDLTSSRGKRQNSPRDNVIFELGLFMGCIGRERTFVIYDKTSKLKLPSDLAGVSLVTYLPHSSGSLQSALGGPCFHLRQAIKQFGPRRL